MRGRCAAAIVVLGAASCGTACGRIDYDPIASAYDAGRDPDDAGGDPIDAGGDPIDAGSCPITIVDDYCDRIPRLVEDPTIDGVLDCGVELHTLVPVGWQPHMGAAIPPDFAARYAVGWYSEGLYVYMEVDDTSRIPSDLGSGMLYCGDAPEIYVDNDGMFENPPDYDDPGTLQIILRAPEDDTTPSMVADLYRFMVLLGPWGSPRFGVWPRPGGYVLEARVTGDDLVLGEPWLLAAGQRVGFDLSVNVSQPDRIMGDCGYRLGQLFLRVSSAPGPGCGLPYCDVRAFCTPTLVD